MIKSRRFPKIYFGWWTVLAGGFLAFWGHGYHTYGFSALFKPIASELGFSRVATSVPAAIGRLEGGFESPLSGWISDRFGPRWIVIFGIFVMSLSLILMNFIDSLWAFYTVWGVMLGTGFNIAVTLPLDTAISNWFVKKRGVALSIKMVFSGLSGVLVLPLVAWLLATQGWRMTCVIGGLVMALVGLPLAWFFLKQHRPEYYGLLPDGATAKEAVAGADRMINRGVEYAAEVQEVEFTLRQAMRAPAYWLLIVVHGIHGLAASAINIHCIPFLTDIEIDPFRAAGMMAIMVAAGIPARLISGLLADRVSRSHLRFLLGGAYLLQGMGLTIFLLNQTTAMIYIWFIFYGMGMGAAWTLSSPVRARYFGRKAFGSIGGSSMLFMTPMGVVAPIYFGWVHDTTGSYMSGFTLIAILLVSAAVLAYFILPPKLPARITDIRKIM
ncbi:MFS transporter [Chloroflexota bacterium]